MCLRWRRYGWTVFGTYRTPSAQIDELRKAGVTLSSCDVRDRASIQSTCASLREQCEAWDVLVLAPGRQEPVGPFAVTPFDEWEEGIHVNFLGQLRVIHELLPTRRRNTERPPCVALFAGGGTNNAVLSYSSYTVSKIALIKMCELLDAELGDTRFVIIGPGWVKTKIHQPTLSAGEALAGDNYQKTLAKLAGDECTTMDRILDCFDWAITTPCNAVSGRNFSVVFDPWGKEALEEELRRDPHMYKLRRWRNDWRNDPK